MQNEEEQAPEPCRCLDDPTRRVFIAGAAASLGSGLVVAASGDCGA